MLFRGQAYGDSVGEWWTTSRDEAEKFAMSRGGNRTYVVLGIDRDEGEPWLAPMLHARRDGEGQGNWYPCEGAEDLHEETREGSP